MLFHEVLENGLEVVLKENHFAKAVAIQAWVGVGSLHERPDERGMAHFLEHMLFKGTARRKVGEIAATVEACGGEINAYTTFDHTVFHLTMAAPHAEVGVDLLCDAFAHSAIDAGEFTREREVILEEIRRGNDSPGARVGKRVFELSFAGTEGGRPIIGSEASVRSFHRDSVHAFYRRWYVPRNATLVVVGDFEIQTMRQLIKASFGALPAAAMPEKPEIRLPPRARAGATAWPVVSVLRGDFQQPRIELVWPAPPLDHFDSAALDLAAFALGSGEMSRLNRRLRDGEGCVNSVGSSVYAPLFGGIFEVSALVTNDLLLTGVRGIAREVSQLRTREPVHGEELQRARASLKADRVYQEETVDGQARTLGFGLRTPQKLLFDDVYHALVNAMPETAIAGAAERWLAPERATIVVLVHNDTPLSDEAVAEAFRQGVVDADIGTGTQAPGVAPISKGAKREAQAEIITLKPGLKLVYRHNPNVELFTVTAATEGGLRAEAAANAGVGNAMAHMLATANTVQPYAELLGAIEGMGASLEGFSGKDSFGFHVQCLDEHAPVMLNLWRDCLLQPVFPEEQWDSLRREIEQALKAQHDSPASIAIRRFQEMLYGEHPYRFPLLGTEQSVPELNPAGLLRHYATVANAGPWVVAVASTRPAAEVVRLLSDALTDFVPQPRRRTFSSDDLAVQPRGVTYGSKQFAKDREQSHLVYGFPGLTWGDVDRAALDVLINVLGGHGGRLFRELRDKDSLAYTVSPMISYGVHPGIVGAYIACAPEKAGKAMESLQRELMALTASAPTGAEVERARAHIIGSHDMSLQKSDAQTSTMALMELYGFGYDDFLKYPKAISQVSAADVLRVAQRLFRPERAVSVTVGPG